MREGITARELHDYAQCVAVAMFASHWPSIAASEAQVVPQRSESASYYRRDSLEKYRDLTGWPVGQRDRIRRGLTFPPFPMPKEPV
jgi:methionyl-tRNA formyltransferase